MYWGADGERDDSFALSLLHFARCGSERDPAQRRLGLTEVSKGAAMVENLQNIPCRESKETAWGRRAEGWKEIATDKSQRADQDSQKDTRWLRDSCRVPNFQPAPACKRGDPPGVSYLQGQEFIAPQNSPVPGEFQSLFTQAGPKGMDLGLRKLKLSL